MVYLVLARRWQKTQPARPGYRAPHAIGSFEHVDLRWSSELLFGMEQAHRVVPRFGTLLAFYAGTVGTFKLSLSSTSVPRKLHTDIDLREDLEFSIFSELNGTSPVSPEKEVGQVCRDCGT